MSSSIVIANNDCVSSSNEDIASVLSYYLSTKLNIRVLITTDTYYKLMNKKTSEPKLIQRSRREHMMLNYIKSI